MIVQVCLLPLWELWSSDLLPRGIHVAHHEVLRDLLHVFVVEERVEAQLVCGREELIRGGWGERMGGHLCSLSSDQRLHLHS